MPPSQEMLDAVNQIDGPDAGQDGANQVEQEVSQDPTPKTEPTSIDPAEFRKIVEELNGFKTNFNRVNSELGNFRKTQADFEKFRQTNSNTNTTPKSWSELDEATRKQSVEMMRHIIENELGYKERFEKYDSVAEGYTTNERRTQIVGLAQGILGSEFEKYNDEMGHIVTTARKAAESGDPRAARFMEELNSGSESAVYRLADLAKANLAKSIQAQSEKAKLEQEQKAKRVSTGVGGAKSPAGAGSGKNGLPVDKGERLAKMREALDDYYSANG